MMNHLDPREVLAYLNELGYYHITAEQLKEFMKDLKKLIKHDQRLARTEDKENKEPGPSYASMFFSNLHANSTVASRAKTVPKYEKIITLHITKPRVPQPSASEEYYREEDEHFTAATTATNISAAAPSTEPDVNSAKSTTSSRPRSCLKDNKRPQTASTKCAKDDELKPKVSFIRPRLPLKPCKSDPVALYQYYQSEWKKQKLPGEDNRANLRWAIRERMLGAGEPLTRAISSASSTNTLARKRT